MKTIDLALASAAAAFSLVEWDANLPALAVLLAEARTADRRRARLSGGRHGARNWRGSESSRPSGRRRGRRSPARSDGRRETPPRSARDRAGASRRSWNGSGWASTATSSAPSSSSATSLSAVASTKASSTPGCARRKWLRKPTARSGPTVHITPKLTAARSSLRKPVAVLRAASDSSSTRSRCGRISRPSSVRCVRLRSRRKSCPPNSSSRPLIARVSAGCVTLQRSAARVKFSVSQRATK